MADQVHSLWHGDLMEKVTLTDEDQTAYQLTLQDDYSRVYVFCDLYREPTVNTTIGAMISAMREYQTIPKAVVFDNGPTFSILPQSGHPSDLHFGPSSSNQWEVGTSFPG